jgi:hypothetical protein
MRTIREHSVIKSILRSSLIAATLLIAMPVSAALASRVANAEVTQKDFQVILRTIGFMQNVPSGDATFAIIYDSNVSGSMQDARDLQAILKNGITDKTLTLRPQLVPVSNLESLKDARFVFVTAGLESHYDEIGKLARKNNALSFTLDRSCAEQGHCIVYVSSSGRVEIVINKQAAEGSSIEFKPVFLMMVTTL